MSTIGILSLILTVIISTFLITTVVAGHLGGYKHKRSLDTNIETRQTSLNDNIRRKTNEEILAEAQDAVLELPFAARIPETSKPRVNLFEEYMSRGLYTCTSSYLDALGKLHALIAEVYEDYQTCQKMMKTTAKTFSRTDIDALDDMLDEWEKEDETQKPSETSLNSQINSTPEPRIGDFTASSSS